MSSQSQICAIVEGYSTGKYLASAFREKGFNCVHIRTPRKEIPVQSNSQIERDYIDVIEHDDDIEKTLAALSKYNLKCLLPGWEPVVELADLLSERLGLPSNGTVLSAARRDKYKMIEAIKKCGLRSVEHFKSNQLESILQWVDKIGSWPVVVKPLKSGGTDGVKICYSQDEVAQGFELIMGTTNKVGLINQEVLVQTYLQGTEFMVDTVSYAGEHCVTEIWQSQKKYHCGAYVYDLEELIPYEGEKQSLLIDYIYRVLDALGIKYGPAHSEVMLTADGPVLIEIGARLHGGINPAPVAEALGYNHVTATVEAYLDPHHFLEQFKKPYQLRKRLFCVELISEFDGKIIALPGVKKVEELPSFFSIAMKVGVNDLLEKTADVFSGPGVVYLVHEDRSLLEKDYQKIRELEKDGFYQLVNQ